MTPLVFLHGIGTGPGAWQPQLVALSTGREVLAPDLVPYYACGWEAALDRVRALVDQHRPVDLCGLSLGGLLALKVAEERLEQEDRLVVCAAFDRLPPRLRRRVRMTAAVMSVAPKGLLHRQLAAEIPEPYRARALTEIDALAPRQLSRLMRQAASVEVDPRTIVARTLVLCGDRDLANLPLGRELSASLGRATFALVPDAGHVANLDNSEAFTTLVADFLASPA